jgi:hypothetical protein
VTDDQIHHQKKTNFKNFSDSSNVNNFWARLSKYIRVKDKDSNGQSTALVAKGETTYLLDNAGTFFKHMREKDEKARAFLRDAAEEGLDCVYLVVGYKTVLDASFRTVAVAGTETVLSAATAAAAIGQGLGGSHSHENDFTAPGEQVYAIQYRKISFKWYWRKDIDKASLKESRWLELGGVRGDGDEEDEEVIELLLSDLDTSGGDDNLLISEDGGEAFLV